jgi:hypothetical protein
VNPMLARWARVAEEAYPALNRPGMSGDFLL